MTTDRDPVLMLRTFLDDGPELLPAESYDAVRAEIDRIPQRAVRGSWRTHPMLTSTRVAIATLAVLAAALAVATIRPRVDQVGKPTSSPSATDLGSPVPTEARYAWPGPLAAGTYRSALVWNVGYTFRFTVPGGWLARDIEVLRPDDAAWVSFQLVSGVATDPCAKAYADLPTGPAAEDLVGALRRVPGVDVFDVRSDTLGGEPAVYLEYELRPDAPCAAAEFFIWQMDASAVLPNLPFAGADWPARPGRHRVWILALGEERLVIDAGAAPATDVAIDAEVQAIVDSIAFEAPVDAIRTGDCTLEVDGTDPTLAGVTATLRNAPIGELNGPVPSPFPIAPPLVEVRYTGEGWSSFPGAELTPPSGHSSHGFSTWSVVGGWGGSVVLDAPGRWWARVAGDRDEPCVRQFWIDVRPVQAP